MAITRNDTTILSSKGFIYTLLFLGLIVMSYALIFQNKLLYTSIIFAPIAIMLCVMAIRKPMISYIMYAVVVCYFAALYRYAGIDGLSGILDIFLLICLISIMINIVNNHSFAWQLGLNALTLGYGCWSVICLFQILNPHATEINIIGLESIFFTVPATYFLSGILLNSPKKLRVMLLLLGVYVITAAFKLYWQKYRGWDSTEVAWLMAGAWHTHILQSGIRYFSFFSDAGNFGAIMGMFTITFGIITFNTANRYLMLFFLLVTTLSGIGLMMSGTRGAMIVPFGGIFLYMFLSKSIKVLATASIIGTLIFCFFYFTDIGEGNVFIRRMRTAFRPTEDASYSVRLNNQKRFAHYLNDKPFGVGLGGRIVDKEELMNTEEDFIPTDSHYVGVWVETGIVGISAYLLILTIIVLRCCYIIMFRIQNKELRNLLAALLCGVFGLWLSGYVNRAMGFHPGRLITAMFISFVLNGPYIEKQLKQRKQL